MACKQDVKSAILNQVMTELVEGRYTFQRVSEDSVIITNQGVAKSKAQAEAVAMELVKRVNKSFLGHVNGEISQATPYDPVTIRFSPSEAYINHVYSNLDPSKKITTNEEVDQERDHINTNSGYNSYEQLTMFDVSDEAGAFEKYIRFKQDSINILQGRLNKIQAEKKNKNLTTEQLAKLNKQEREIKLQINGNEELKIKGLKQEIAELKRNADINAVGFYAEKDLQRLAKLANSENIDDLNEAKRIIDFYQLAGTFKFEAKDANPFFTAEEMFLKDDDGKLTHEHALNPDVMQQFKDWADRASAYENIVDKREQDAITATVNTDPSVKRTYNGKQFTYSELTYGDTGLKDADWISMWTMDITNGIFSHNGIIPQVAFSYLANAFETELSRDKQLHERINGLIPKVQSVLIKKGHTLRAGGIVGLKGASYNLFKEVTKEGNETGGLVQRYVKEFYDAQSKALNAFSSAIEKANGYDDYVQKTRAYNKAFEDLKRWRRNNTIIMDMNRLPEFNPKADNTHKDELTKILGEKGYKEEVEKQKQLLTKYEADRQSVIETALEVNGVDSYDKLDDKAKSAISLWEHRNSPKNGVDDYYSVNGIFHGDYKESNFMRYNNFIPRANQVDTSVDQATNQYKFTDNSKSTGHYSENFKQIESDPTLSEFYDVVKEALEDMRRCLPPELQAKMAVNTIPGLQKTFAEIVADRNTGFIRSLFDGARHLYERLRLGFGVTKQSELSYAVIDPITGKPNYKVNDTFIKGNTKAVQDRMTIEKAKFLQALNSTRKDADKINKISRFTSITLSSLNTAALVQLAQYLHVDIPLADIQAGRIDAIKRITGDNVEIGKYIRDFSLHSIVQSQSFDLPKVIKYFSTMSKTYAAREKALPILEIMKNHYESIKKPITNNLGSKVYNVNSQKYMMQGLRTNANRQFDDWFNRVAVGDYDTKHIGPHGLPTKVDKLVEGFKSKIPRYFKEIYTDDEKKKMKEIKELKNQIINGRDVSKLSEEEQKKVADLDNITKSFGKVRTATAMFDNFFGYLRVLRLGYNLSSASTNFLEGVTSNMILGSLNEYFDPKEIFYGYHVIKHSFVKNLTFGYGETGLAKKNRSLMDKFNVMMDSRNELQKSSSKSYADKVKWLDPHSLNTRVEYINQSPIMIAMLRTMKIKDKNGNEARLWDAYDNHGHLKDEFRTEENIKNWEELTGDDYLTFKQKMHKAIVIGHGNYDELRGMMVKSSSGGKALAMFKTWLPMQLYWRFATQQDDIQGGTIGYKGRYWSYGKGSGLVHGAVVGAAAFGPLGAAIGAGIGLGFGGFFGADTGVSMLKETLETTKQLAKKMIGMPVNLIVGKQIIGQGTKAFDSWVGKGNFTEQDAKNMRGNMADISMQLAWLALILLVKGMFWDDDDKPDMAERKTHNILVNKLMQLSTQAGMYSGDVVNTYKSVIGDNAVVSFFKDAAKWTGKAQDYFNGNDIESSGPNRGKSGLALQTKKMIMPGAFKDTMFGFESQSESVFTESPWHEYFHGDEYLDKRDNKAKRAEMKIELEKELSPDDFDGETPEDQQKARDREIRHRLDLYLPTTSKLKKLDMTRKEYNEQLEQETSQ